LTNCAFSDIYNGYNWLKIATLQTTESTALKKTGEKMNKPANLRLESGLLIALCVTAAILIVSTSQTFGAAPPGQAVDTLRLFSEVRFSSERQEVKATLGPDAFDRSKAGPALQAIALPVEANKTVTLELERFNVLAPDVRFYLGGPAGNTLMDPPQVVLMRGKVVDDPKSFAFFAISSSGMVNGFVDKESGNDYVFATLREDLAAGNNTVTVRQTAAFDPFDVPFCGTEISEEILQQFEGTARTPFSNAGPLLNRVGIDADQAFVQMFGNTVECVDYIVQLMGAVSAIYERDLDFRLTLVFARIWPSGGEPFNPYDLYGFRQHWWDNEDTTGLNLIHMFSGVRNTSYGGVSFISNTCNGSAYGIDAYLNGSFLAPVTYPDNGNWDLNVVAHEMGHNHGTGHTHDDYRLDPLIDECGSSGIYTRGTIMSYCHTTQGYQRNIDLRFHRRIQEIIQSVAGAAGCQPHDCNGNNVGDDVDIATATSQDVNSDGIPDECQDCNNNSILDPQDIAMGAPDVDGNGIPDECEADCNGNNVPDQHETWIGSATDDDGNNVPDECDPDCNGNLIVDYVDINNNMALDLDRNRILDSCEDCNGNGIWDWYDIDQQYSLLVCNQGFGSVRQFHGLSGVYVNQYALTQPWDVVSSNDGQYVYIADATGVYRLTVASGAVAVFIAIGDGGLSLPSGLEVDAFGDIYVSDFNNDAVKRYNSSGVYLGDYVASGVSPLNGPIGLEFGPSGNLYVTSSINNAVYEYGGGGVYIGPFVTSGSGGLSGVKDIAFLDNGNMVVTSNATDQILEYAAGLGTFVRVFSDEYGWTEPWGITKGPNGNIFLTGNDGGQWRVFEYFQDGRYYRSFVRGVGFLSVTAGLCFLPGSPNDLNQNWVLDVCEGGDLDGDGVPNVTDNCPTVSNAGQTDSDNDGVGDACDNCQSQANADQRDVDNDGFGDVCDNCPAIANVSQSDGDNDGRGDACDDCPDISNADQADADGDFIGDLCDACPNDFNNDADGDGFCADVDNCPSDYNPDQEDANGNGIGDVCEPETIDSVATTCLQLAVGSQGNFGHQGEAGATLDYLYQGDCEWIYLYDGSPMIVQNQGTDTLGHFNVYGKNKFKPYYLGNPTVPTTNMGDYEVFESGTFISADSAVGLEKKWYAPKQSDSCQFVIQSLRVYSQDGNSHSGLAVGEFIDWDVPAVSASANTGGYSSGSKLIYQIGTGYGCQDNTRRFGGLALIGFGDASGCIDTGVSLYGALTQSDSIYVFPNHGPVAEEMYQLMSQSGYSALATAEDQFSLMTYFFNWTVTPGDTTDIYTVLTTIRNGTSADLLTNVAKAKKWLVDHLLPVCPPSCCVGIRGNVNGDPGDAINVADVTYLVAYLKGLGPAPTCMEEADVDGSGTINVSDVTYLVAYLKGLGPAPPACP
jgi:hypothetical protein